ncbi:MAG: 50S ribosomal protein L30 [Thermoplasmata archaeon]
MTYAVLRLRSSREKKRKAETTMKQLRLRKVNHCALLPENESSKGMLNVVKDVVAYGEIDKKTLIELLEKRSNLGGEMTDKKVNEDTDYESIEEFAVAIIDEGASLDEIKGLKNIFRMHPPIGGYKSIKKPYNAGGDLGYRGSAINDLLQRMMGPLSQEE